MSTEKFEAAKAKIVYHIGFDKAEELIQEIKSYATQEVEKQTKQLKEERQLALELLAQCDAYERTYILYPGNWGNFKRKQNQ